MSSKKITVVCNGGPRDGRYESPPIQTAEELKQHAVPYVVASIMYMVSEGFKVGCQFPFPSQGQIDQKEASLPNMAHIYEVTERYESKEELKVTVEFLRTEKLD